MLNHQIQSIRKSLAISQSQAATLANTSQQAVSRIETSGGTALNTFEGYANSLGCDVRVMPPVSPFFMETPLYKLYHKVSQQHLVIISHVAALEALGLFSGFAEPYVVECYTPDMFNQPGLICHHPANMNAVGAVFSHGVLCTDIDRTLDDILCASERIDDSVILEALNYYYYKNDETFNNLRLGKKAWKVLDSYLEDAVSYS